MSLRRTGTAVIGALALAGCSPPASDTERPEAAVPGIPADVAAMVVAAVPDINITSGELSAGNDQYEVTGTLSNGDELEFDMVQLNGVWTLLEIQRDVVWSSVPEPVLAEAAGLPDPFEPVRVIESTQAEDGSIV